MHHRRKRPRNQPSSVLSSPGRVFKDPRDKEVEEDECSSPPKPKRKRNWVIQRRYIVARSPAASIIPKTYQKLQEWNNYRRYYTQKSRDIAFEKFSNEHKGTWEYRKVDPD